MKLFLVRHGETKEGLKYNGVTNVPLNQKGYRQAERIRKRLARAPLSKIYTSDLSRARETARIINLPHRMELKTEPDLREINFGLWEGLSFSEIRARHRESLQKWMEEGVNFRFPKGESLKELRKRVLKVLKRIKKEHEDEAVAIVSHGGPLRAILCEIAKSDLSNFWKIAFRRGELRTIEWEN